ncbi:MAG: hypothetical protein RJQ14_18280, partial [Marinoscillum sp.]
ALVLSIVLITSCTDTYIGPPGPVGPQGPQGPQGADGESGYVFEWENVDFTAPEYEVLLSYPDNFEGFDSDVALVYFLWDAYTTDGGEEVEVWRQLSQNILTDDGIHQYNYEFSKYNVLLIMDAEFPLDMLRAMDTDNWVVRVVVVPGGFWNSGRIDFADYHEVEQMLGLPEIPHNLTNVERRK